MRKLPRFSRPLLAFVALALFAATGVGYAQTSSLSSVSAAAAMPGSEILKLTTAGKHEEARTRALARIAEIKDDIDAYVSLSWSLT